VTKTVSGTTTRLDVGATSVSSFLGAGASTSDTADDIGVRLSGGTLGLILTKDTASTDSAKFALVANGTVELVGVPGLTLTGTISVRVNRTGTALNDSVTVGSHSVTLDFRATGTNDVTAFTGTGLTLAISGFVSLKGDLTFEKLDSTAAVTDTFTN